MKHSLLFAKLLHNGLPGVVVRFLASWYSSQELRVRWGCAFSDPFGVSNGVRQGGVLSPVLFSVYLDTLLVGFKESGVGCHWEGEFAGAFAYADDIVLLAPSLSALRLMLSHCEDFADSHGLTFNPSKTQFIEFSLYAHLRVNAQLLFCGTQLPLLNEVVHLGHVLTNNLSDDADIKQKCWDMVRKANTLLATFPYLPPNVLTFLF